MSSFANPDFYKHWAAVNTASGWHRAIAEHLINGDSTASAVHQCGELVLHKAGGRRLADHAAVAFEICVVELHPDKKCGTNVCTLVRQVSALAMRCRRKRRVPVLVLGVPPGEKLSLMQRMPIGQSLTRLDRAAEKWGVVLAYANGPAMAANSMDKILSIIADDAVVAI